MQSKQELEEWYKTPDPWGYETNSDDDERIRWILNAISDSHFDRALDIGAGEGLLTKLLPSRELHGIEISDLAASRFPATVKRVYQPQGKYGLVIATGVLYKQYNWRQMLDWIHEAKHGTVIVAGIEDWLVPEIAELGSPSFTGQFPYREFVQSVRVYE